jgi:uncharacterized DUF497 family protein
VALVRFVAGELTFEWDGAKATANRRKHGISFEEAATVFLDEHAQIFDDPDSGTSEMRYLLLGLSAARRTLLVVHVERGTRLRIISAREATRRERRALEEG